MVCPPKGSNTALNHDLEKVGNTSLTDDLKDELVDAAVEIFLIGPHKEYVKAITAKMNSENFMDVYLGFQTLPINVKLNIWKVYSSAFEGRIQSPWFGENMKPTYYKTQHSGKYIVQFPRNLKDLVGKNGSLVIRLEVNTDENQGSSEEYVTISKGSRKLDVFGYSLGKIKGKNFHTKSPENWADSEYFCARNGGHLVSIKSKAEKDELDVLIGGFGSIYAIGAKKYDSGWKWFDGSPWNHNNSVFDINTEFTPGNCLAYDARDKNMYTKECKDKNSIICDLGHTKFSGFTNATYAYKGKDIQDMFSDIIVKHHQPKTDNFDHQKKKNTGFILDWTILNGSLNYEIQKNYEKGCIKTPVVVGIKGNYTIMLNIPLKKIVDKVLVEVRTDIQRFYGVEGKMYYNFFRKKYFRFVDTYGNDHHCWQEADSKCLRQGGHLASVHSPEDLKGVGEAVGDYETGVWLGGRLTRAGHWSWSDGSPWDYENWDTEDPEIRYGSKGHTNNCTVVWDDLTWWDEPCSLSHKNIIACQKNSWVNAQHVHIPSNTTKLKFTKENFTSATFHIWWEYEVTNLTLLVMNRNRSFPSFQLNWNVGDEPINDTKCDLGNWTPVRGENKYKNNYFLRLANLAREAATHNIMTEWLLTRALEYKVDIIRNESLEYKDWCKYGEVQEEYKADVFEGYMHAVGMISSSDIIR